MKQTPKLLVLKGLSASGKTTHAKKLEAQGWIRIEKDDIRLDANVFPDGYKYPKDENKVVQERDKRIRSALRDDLNVVSSDTNLNPAHIKQLQAIARQFGADFSVDDSFLAVPMKEVIERDSKRANSVGEQVIRDQFHKWVKKMPTFLMYDPNLPWLVVSDIDGTLTNGPKNRSPYEWQKVGNDDINLGVAKILDGVRVIDTTKIFLFSGRSDVCRPETKEWLDKHDIEYDELFMRSRERESEKDTNIKGDMVEQHIRGKYNVLFWLDDRPQVVRMLRDVYGINVLARGDQRHEF